MASKSNSPWNIPSDPVPSASLTDVMSEQLASDLQAKELEQPTNSNSQPELTDEELAKILANDTDDDLIIAQMLQMQFDREYDQALGFEESHRNGTSKVTVSYEKYKAVPDNPIWDDSEDGDEELAAYLNMDDKKRHWDW